MKQWIVGVCALVVMGGVGYAAQQAKPPSGAQQPGTGWQIPPDAGETRNPLTVDAKVLDAGKQVFADKCQRCHGPAGLGDGPDAEPEHRADMDLTNPRRAARNTDGVVYHKVLNGRARPKMPAFRDELTKDQIWRVVAYVQSLRKRS